MGIKQLTLIDEEPVPGDSPNASYDLLDQAIKEHNPTHVFGLFSGGNDSSCSAYLAAQHPRFSGMVHVNTGIGVEETRQHVRDVCASRRWPLLEIHPPNKTFRDMVLDPEWGFPGPAAHRYAYIWLKERALQKLIRDHKRGYRDRIALPQVMQVPLYHASHAGDAGAAAIIIARTRCR